MKKKSVYFWNRLRKERIIIVTTWRNVMIGNNSSSATLEKRKRTKESERERERNEIGNRQPGRWHRPVIFLDVHTDAQLMQVCACIDYVPTPHGSPGRKGREREGWRIEPRRHQLRPRLQLHPHAIIPSSSRGGSIDRSSDIALPPSLVSPPSHSFSSSVSFCSLFRWGSCVSYFSPLYRSPTMHTPALHARRVNRESVYQCCIEWWFVPGGFGFIGNESLKIDSKICIILFIIIHNSIIFCSIRFFVVFWILEEKRRTCWNLALKEEREFILKIYGSLRNWKFIRKFGNLKYNDLRIYEDLKNRISICLFLRFI